MNSRISWDEFFMSVADSAAKRSTCLVRKVGAVITLNNRIIATGYNGACSGAVHCIDTDVCVKRSLGFRGGTGAHVCVGVHAEQNAIIQCAVHGVSCVGGVLYCTALPCLICTKILVNAGVKYFICRNERRDVYSEAMYEQAGVIFKIFT